MPTGLAAEFFASTLDVYLTLREVTPTPRITRPRTGGRPRPKPRGIGSARMIGADRDSFSNEDAEAFAWAADECLLGRLMAAVERACLATVGRPEAAVIAGSGGFVARPPGRAG